MTIAAPSRELPYRLVEHLMDLAEEPSADGLVELVGSDPVLPTAFRLGEAGAAVIAAAAVEAARVFELRAGVRQRALVEVDAAAAAMRSARYLQPLDPNASAPTRRAAGLSVFPTRDGRWIYFQRLFPHHQRRLTEVLGCRHEDEAIGSAVASWEAFELEEAVVAAGACAGAVRTRAEWDAHGQAESLQALPLFEMLERGTAPALRLPEGDRPLSGLRVLDVTRVLAGPTCARTLAEHGADVLRVAMLDPPDNEAMMRDTGHGKRSCVLDLRSPDGVARLEALLADADVFVQGYRPGALDELGFSPDRLLALRPGLVHVSISAFGHLGPWAGRRGFDSVVQAVSGIASEEAREGIPRFLPANPLDYLTGYLAAFATLVAIRRRIAEGGGYQVRASLAQTGHWLSGLPRVDPALVERQPAELPAERLAQLMVTTTTPFGRLRHLAPAAQLEVTPARWDLPSVPPDHDAPGWRGRP